MAPEPGQRQRVRCVVWDVDDTLYLERDYARSGFAAVGAHLERTRGLAGFSERAWAAFEAGARRTIFDDVLDALGVAWDRALIGELVRVYREHAPDIRLAGDAAAAIDALRGDVVMAVVTDGPRASQHAKVDALGLRAFCDPVVVTADLGEGFGKPHPRAFEAIAAQHGLAGAQLAYVADNPAKDFVAPRALGWRTIRVRRPGGLHHDEPSGDDVDVEIPDLGHLTEAL